MIEFKNVFKRFSNGQIGLKNINFKIKDGEFICLIGGSGAGKTTCMRMINRMDEITSGEIIINNKNIKEYNPVKLRRKIGYVIQQIGLMPHMTIFENIVLIPKLLKWDNQKLNIIAKDLIDKINLPIDYLQKYPHELSGGQQQRIGVIRALAANQDIILMDEPFGALDPITRNSLQNLIKKLQIELKKTIIFVTHDIDEALKLADRIAIMNKGEIIQFDTPENILKNPNCKYVEEFIGIERLIEAKTFYNTVDTVMNKNPISINCNKTNFDAISLMRNKRVDSILIVDAENHLEGIIDIFELGKFGKKEIILKDIMREIKPINVSTKIIDAITQFAHLKVKNLSVIDDKNHLVGILTRASIVDIMYENVLGDYERNLRKEYV